MQIMFTTELNRTFLNMDVVIEWLPQAAIIGVAVVIKTKSYFFNGRIKDKKQHDSRLGNNV